MVEGAYGAEVLVGPFFFLDLGNFLPNLLSVA